MIDTKFDVCIKSVRNNPIVRFLKCVVMLMILSKIVALDYN